jgi:hypothetical protein
MIGAYAAGIPGNGKPVPDGAKMAKIHWTPTPNESFPTTTVPGNLVNVAFMVKDSKRFADSGGWGYAVFDYHPDSNTFTPHESEDQRLRFYRVREALKKNAKRHRRKLRRRLRRARCRDGPSDSRSK